MTTNPHLLRVAFYSAYYVTGDATSQSLALKVRALEQKWQDRVDIKIYCKGSNINDSRVRVLSLPELLGEEYFQQADLHIYEFGWYYELFNSILLCPARSKKIVYYHGITPEKLSRNQLEARLSIMQKANLLKADLVLHASSYSGSDLNAYGLPEESIRMLPLPVMCVPKNPVVKKDEGVIRLLWVGRFVPYKGVLDLLDALTIIVRNGCANFVLQLVANPDTASPDFMAEVHGAIKRNNLKKYVEIAGGISDTEKMSACYRAADMVILPSYHDSYCLPVLEAFAHGCCVIAYDSSNLPNITNGWARLVPTGDVRALAEAIQNTCAALRDGRKNGQMPEIDVTRGKIPLDVYRTEVANYARGFDVTTFQQQFVGCVTALLDTK